MALKNIINSSLQSKDQNNKDDLKQIKSLNKEEEKKVEENKEEEKKNEEKKEEEKKEDSKEGIKNRRKSVKDNLALFQNIFATNKNKSTLDDMYKSLETDKNFEMSALKYPPKYEEEEKKGILNLNLLKKQKVNYPLSAIGLLKCEYSNGLTMYGTGTLINLNMVLTCAHVLYSPILKKKM